MNVVEIFHSLQGEGRLAGVPSVFIRLAGCPLRCRWCDTRYAWDPAAGTDLGIEEILAKAKSWPARFAVITGGEPMATGGLRPRPHLGELTQLLKAEGFHVTIETAGVVFIPDLVCDLMSISPKLDHAGTYAVDVEVVRRLAASCEVQVKFVVDSPSDAAQVRRIVEQVGGIGPMKVMLMPQARTPEELMAKSPMVAQMCLENGWVFGQRLHIQLWGGQRGR